MFLFPVPSTVSLHTTGQSSYPCTHRRGEKTKRNHDKSIRKLNPECFIQKFLVADLSSHKFLSSCKFLFQKKFFLYFWLTSKEGGRKFSNWKRLPSYIPTSSFGNEGTTLTALESPTFFLDCKISGTRGDSNEDLQTHSIPTHFSFFVFGSFSPYFRTGTLITMFFKRCFTVYPTGGETFC